MYARTTLAGRLLAGAALTGVAVLSVGVPATAATPSGFRTHTAHRAVPASGVPSHGVSIGTAVAFVHGPGGTPVAVAPTALP